MNAHCGDIDPQAARLVPDPLLFIAALLCLALLACDRPRGAPEEEIHRLIDAAESAAESRDLDTLSGFISDDYADERGLDRGALRKTLRVVFLRHRSIHLVSRVREIRFPRPDEARVSVLLAFASRPLPSEAPLRLNADIYHFDLELVDEGRGSWRLTQASWRPARGSELLLEPAGES